MTCIVGYAAGGEVWMGGVRGPFVVLHEGPCDEHGRPIR
jgi:hypothetical protein